MVNCSHCWEDITGLPFNCHRCTGEYCSKHRLPEDHDCPGLLKRKEKNQERWKKVIQGPSYKKERKRKISHQRKKGPSEKLSHFLTYKTRNFSNWLNSRGHHRYNFERRFNYLLGIILPLAISIVAYVVFYSNAQKLNEINLWIIKLGGILILISIFFIIKYGIRFIKELINILKRQKNWLKYLIVILIFFLLWQAYTNNETILNPVFDIYDETNFSLFSPINLGNFSFESNSDSSAINKEIPISSDFRSGLLNSDSKRDVGIMEQEILILVNEERQKYGARSLTAKSNLNSFARGWSDKMISQNFFEHSNLNFPYPSIAGENIGETPIHYDVIGCGSTYTNNQLAKCFVEGWIGSHGHHENMIDNRFSMTGIGVSCDSSKCRATQVFSG